jgi:hypothetical protein
MPPAQATIEGPTVCAVDHSWDSNPDRDGFSVTSTTGLCIVHSRANPALMTGQPLLMRRSKN